MERNVQCQLCGLGYVDPIDNREHSRKHKRFLTLSGQYALPQYGPLLWAYVQREAEKRWLWPLEECTDLPMDVRVSAAERRLYAWFCRSVEAYNDDDHPHPIFACYCAMMMADPARASWPNDLREALLEKYGKQHDGILNGKSYFAPRDSRRAA